LVNDQQVQLNRTLEDAVQKRTHELEVQNRQLTEYAFVNAHLLRAPLARVLGLAHLIARESAAGDRQLLQALETSATELDQIIRNISELLYAGNDFSREDVKAMINRQFDRQKPVA
jgi:signal transduction histidine kinase